MHKPSEHQPLPTSLTPDNTTLAHFPLPLDELSLRESLEGIDEPGHYFEVVFKTQQGLPKSISLKLFPVVRVLFRTPLYSVARLYIGSNCSSDAQYDVVSKAYVDDWIIDYERVYPAEVRAL